MEFALRLRQLRRRKRVSARVLSQLCGLSKNMIARYEDGSAQPGIRTAALLADYFQISVDELLGRKEEQAWTANRTWREN